MSSQKKKRSRAQTASTSLKKRLRFILSSLSLGLLAVLVWLMMPLWRLTAELQERPTDSPSRLYARPFELVVDQVLGLEPLLASLDRLGYRRLSGGEGSPASGSYWVCSGSQPVVEIGRRPHPSPEGLRPKAHLTVVLSSATEDAVVRLLQVDSVAVERTALEPPLLASFYDDRLEERWPVALETLPESLVQAVLAAEDARFFEHGGVSPTGMLRAAWVNLRGGEVSQGGSTLTQQLVKNLYLDPERTLARKLRELVLASFVELRYSKERILSAYLNQIYWGRHGRVSLRGVEAASRAYFGKPASELGLGEAATLAGMIRAPNPLSPLRHPEAAREARDRILRRLAALGWVDESTVENALESPLAAVPPEPLDRFRFPIAAAALEAQERFGLDSLATGGYVLLSTLSLEDQEAAESAVEEGLSRLVEQGRGHGAESLEAALLSIEPRSGEVLAYVGGRDYQESQYDRLRQARRQPGSAFKPIVYAAALAERLVTPLDHLEDRPIEVLQDGRAWRPQNDDRRFLGDITVREALEKSRNVPTVLLAHDVGWESLIAWARQLGIESPIRAVPSLALGAFEVTPIELLGVYAVFASGGLKPEIHLLRGALTAEGESVSGKPLETPERVLEEGVAYLMTELLEGVIDHGTARSSRRYGVEGPLAGKTGTSSEGRDSWFVGYSPERASLVWVGHDEGEPAGLQGSAAALPIWSTFIVARRPPGGYSHFLPPAGVTTATVDPRSGGLATSRCPEVLTEVFLVDQVPTTLCPLHDRWGRDRFRGHRLWERIHAARRRLRDSL